MIDNQGFIGVRGGVFAHFLRTFWDGVLCGCVWFWESAWWVVWVVWEGANVGCKWDRWCRCGDKDIHKFFGGILPL